MGEENESFYNNLILESIRNNEETPICRIENTAETPVNWKHPLPSENINTSESMENVRPLSVDVRPLSVENSHTKLENYIDEKYDQVAIKYLKEKILNEVKQKFSPSYQEDKINAELVKSLREQAENLQSEISFLREEIKEKNTIEKNTIY